MQATLKPNPLATKQSKTFLRFLLDWAAVITLVLCFVVFGLATGSRFLSVNNMINILRAMSITCLLYTSPSPRDRQKSRMPSSA